MNSTISYSRLLAAALFGVALAGCNAVQDVRDKPFTPVPTPTVVLGGTITGLSSTRSVTLENNGDGNGARSFSAAKPTVPTTGAPIVTPFSFGSLTVGSPYNITVKVQPYGRTCTVTNGSGTLNATTPPNITIDCVNATGVPRYNLTVTIPPTTSVFSGQSNPTVTLTTEEAIYVKAVTPGQTSVTFNNVLMNATGQPGGFLWTVTASTVENSVANKCVVTNPTNQVAGVITNPTGDVTTPIVGLSATTTTPACKFTLAGTASYSTPPGGTTVATMPTGGLTLDVRDVQGNVKTSYDVTAYGAFTIGGTATPTQFNSNSTAVFDIAVSRQPPGQFCVVGNGGSASLFFSGLTNPTSVTTIVVACRNLPVDTAHQLKGVFRLTSSTWTPDITNPVPVTSTYPQYDLTVQNTGSSNMIAFFNDGTFLYGTHANSAQVEHGFYDYDPVAHKLRFTLITDTGPSTAGTSTNGLSATGFPLNFNPVANTGTAGNLTTTTGISATPGPVVVSTVSHRSMANVAVGTGTPRTITGTFGADPQATVATNNRLDWVLTEPRDLPNEMTGTFISQDHRRFWVWDASTYYGYHVGVEGGAASLNDACFTMEDLHQSSGIYTRRGTISGCYPFNRPYTNEFYGVGFAESVDYNSPASLPGFVGRIPGGQSAADGRSPSPIYFHIAPAATYDGDPKYFPAPAVPFTSWCSTQILGIRATLNGNPIDFPVYQCRTRAP